MAIRYFPYSSVGPVVANDPAVEITEGSTYTDIVSVKVVDLLGPTTIFKYWISTSDSITEGDPGTMEVRLSGSPDGVSYTPFKTLKFSVNPNGAGTFVIPEIATYAYLRISARLFTPSPYLSNGKVSIRAGVSPQ